MVDQRRKINLKYLYLSVIINIDNEKLIIRILVFMALMTLLQVKKLNIRYLLLWCL